MIRFGLCCIFREYPVRFRRTTARFLSQFPVSEQRQKLSHICLENARALQKALEFCHRNRIGAFRVNSQILPLKTHPNAGYDITDLPGADRIIDTFLACGEFSRKNHIRLSFHPDQFIVLSSPNADVVHRSMADLVYQAEVAQWVNADVINIHGGGVYQDKPSALNRLEKTIAALPDPVRKRLTLENDDRSYTPRDLLPVCERMKIPLVYDVHHHRCLKDGLTIKEASTRCAETWDREPLFHISSPRDGWEAPDIRKHHDYIDIRDFPDIWLSSPLFEDLTVEVEAKAKELAVLKLMKEMNARQTK